MEESWSCGADALDVGVGVLDVGTRIAEPFFAAMAEAPPLGRAADAGTGTAALVRMQENLPTEADGTARRGIRHWVWEASPSLEKFIAGDCAHVGPPLGAWTVVESGVGAGGAYRLAMEATHLVRGSSSRCLSARVAVALPSGAARLEPGIRGQSRLLGLGRWLFLEIVRWVSSDLPRGISGIH